MDTTVDIVPRVGGAVSKKCRQQACRHEYAGTGTHKQRVRVVEAVSGQIMWVCVTRR